MNEIYTLLISAVPIIELRGALPIALTTFDFPIWKAALLSIAGNMLPIPFILWALDPFVNWIVKKSKIADRFFNWLFEHTRKKTEKNIELYGALALIIFVAIPLPMTGAWTGALAAYIFNINRFRSFWYILLGVIIASVIVSIITLGAKAVF